MGEPKDPTGDLWKEALDAEREVMTALLYDLFRSKWTGKELAMRANLEATADTAAHVIKNGISDRAARAEMALLFLSRFHHTLGDLIWSD